MNNPGKFLIAEYNASSLISVHVLPVHHRLALIIFAQLYFAKLIASIISEVFNPPQLPALIAIIFAHGLIPAMPILLFIFAPMIPAIWVPCESFPYDKGSLSPANVS